MLDEVGLELVDLPWGSGESDVIVELPACEEDTMLKKFVVESTAPKGPSYKLLRVYLFARKELGLKPFHEALHGREPSPNLNVTDKIVDAVDNVFTTHMRLAENMRYVLAVEKHLAQVLGNSVMVQLIETDGYDFYNDWNRVVLQNSEDSPNYAITVWEEIHPDDGEESLEFEIIPLVST